MQAGRDLALTAAQVVAKDDARLQAGRDIVLDTLTESHGDRIARGSRNRHETRSSREIGADIAAGGNRRWSPARTSTRAAASRRTSNWPWAPGATSTSRLAWKRPTPTTSYSKKRGLLSSKTTHIIQSTDQTRAQASTFTGESTVVMAGRRQRQRLERGRTEGPGPFRWPGGEHPPGENTSQDYDYKRVKKSGLGAMGGLSIGTRRQTDSVDGKQVFHTASTVGSVEGNVLIKAGNGLNVVGSNVIARQGDVTLIGQQVNIVAALDTARRIPRDQAKRPVRDGQQPRGQRGPDRRAHGQRGEQGR